MANSNRLSDVFLPETVTSLSDRFRIEDFPQMDHIDATALVYSEDINRLTVNSNARNFVSGISPTFDKPFITCFSQSNITPPPSQFS